MVWLASGAAGALVTWLPRGSGARALLASAIVRLIFSAGPEPTLWTLGMLTVSLDLFDYNSNKNLSTLVSLNTLYHFSMIQRHRDAYILSRPQVYVEVSWDACCKSRFRLDIALCVVMITNVLKVIVK